GRPRLGATRGVGLSADLVCDYCRGPCPKDLTLPLGQGLPSPTTVMRIGELAKTTGVSAKAIRYYETLGLIAPSRLSNGYRDYGEQELRLVHEIRTLTDLGLSVGQTRPFLE